MTSSLLFTIEDADVYDRDLQLFCHGAWLNDTCINFAFKCIDNPHQAIKLIDPAVASFLRLQVEDEDEYEDLRRGLAIDKLTWLFLPINDNSDFGGSSTHWSLLICHIPTGGVYTLDSSQNYNLSSTKSILKKLSTLLVQPLLPLVSIPCPSQQNGYDCGIYVVEFAEKIVALIHRMGLASTPTIPADWQEEASALLHASITPAVASQRRKRCYELGMEYARRSLQSTK